MSFRSRIFQQIFLFGFVITIFYLVGCSSEGHIKIINQTEHNLFFELLGEQYTLAGSATSNPTKTISVDTGKRFILYRENDKAVDLHLEGETFMMQDADNYGNPIGEYSTETTVYVKPGKTTNIYAEPTHACVRIVNNSSLQVDSFGYLDEYDDFVSLVSEEIAAGDSVYCRLIPSTEDIPITYRFTYRFSGEEEYNYEEDIVLELDDLFIISAE